MPWTYKYNPTLQIIEAVFFGSITARDLKESTSEFIAWEKEKDINRFLIDTTEMEFAASLVDVYNLPAKQYQEEKADRNGRVALVLSRYPWEKEAAQFYETVCKNRAWDVQAFSEREEAVNWLTRSTFSNKPDAGDG